MLRFVALLTLSVGVAACGGRDSVVRDDEASSLAELETAPTSTVPVSVRFCDDLSPETMQPALDAGFEPLFDDAGEFVAIGSIVSGAVPEEALEELELAECVVSVERSDERIIIPTVTQ